MPSIRCLLLGALLVAESASAQATFTDGFEGPLFRGTVPPGVWDFVGLQYPNQQMVTEVAAVRRGTLGLRAIDNHGDAGVDSQIVLGRNLTGTGTQYTRVWWRVSASNGIPGALSFLMTQGNTSIGTLAETKWNPATNEVRLVCFDRNATFFSPASPTTVVPDGGFHLIEIALLNVGSNAAQCSYAVDGQERARQIYDQTGTQFRNVLVGPVYGESEWTGVMDYDDFAASPAPIASRVEIAPTVLTLGVCQDVVVRTMSSFSNQPAPVSTPTTIELRIDGGAVFSDVRCGVFPAGGISLPAGVASATVRMRADSLAGLVVAFESDDLVSSTQVLSVVPPDAGVDAGVPDAGAMNDAGLPDAGTVDAGAFDAGVVEFDAGLAMDAGTSDAGVEVDAGVVMDAGVVIDAGADAGRLDAGAFDAGTPDAGTFDAGAPDAGFLPSSNDYAVGCGCSSENGALALFALLLLLTKRRA